MGTNNQQLKPDGQNANKGTDRGRDLLKKSVQELGAGRSILADKDGEIIAGNKTFEAAQEAGLKIRIVPTQGDELVVVQRTDLDLSDPIGEARRLAYLDNRVAELDLAWDAEQVLHDIESGMASDLIGFSSQELQELLAELENANKLVDPGPEIDKANELREKWKTEPGQIWQLGEHRLMCGDCTVDEDLEKLLGNELATLCWTDPPYNVNLGGSDHPTWKRRMINNDNLGDDFPEFVRDFSKAIWKACIPGAVLYMTMGAKEWPNVDLVLREVGFHWSSTIIWVKNQHVLARKDYQTQYEPMWQGVKGDLESDIDVEENPFTPIWYGWKGDAARSRKVINRKQSDVWLIDRPQKSIEHPTIKPLELVERSLRNSSIPGDIVFDGFSGSGTTLIACERMKRKGRAMENDPKFVAVALERWSVMTGEMPTF